MERLEDRHLLASAWQNPIRPADVNADGLVVPLDALQILTFLAHNYSAGRGSSPPDLAEFTPPPFYDVNGDEMIFPLDALMVLNVIARGPNPPRVVSLGLQSDPIPTDPPSEELITADPTVIGRVVDPDNPIQGVQTQLNDEPFADVAFDVAGNFVFQPNLRLDGTDDGVHTVRARATDQTGLTSPVAELVFTLATLPQESVTRLVAVTPAHGENLVSVTRETVIRFDQEIDPATVTAETFFVSAADTPIAARIQVSSTRRFATLFYDQPLPASTQIRVTVDGDRILGLDGRPVDANGDGLPGGLLRTDFRTLPLTRVPGTDVTGYVFDSYNKLPDGSDRPIVGATIRVDAFPEASVVTDATGFFRLIDVPAPDFFVHIDGSTAINAPPGTRYPSVGKPFHSVPGQSVPLKMDGEIFDVYLPPMFDSDMVALSPTTDTVVRFGPGARGTLVDLYPTVDPTLWDELAVIYPPGSAIDASGTPVGGAVVIPVPANRLPAPLAPEVQSSLVISVQAPGAVTFDVPAPVTMPNLDQLPAGSKAELISFDHSAGRWVAVGSATVSADGRSISTDPEVGVLAPGWHIFNPAVQVTGQIRLPLDAQRVGDQFGPYTLPLNLNLIPLSDEVDPKGIVYLAFENQSTGFVSRIRANRYGVFEFLLGAQTSYKLFAYDAQADLAGEFQFTTGQPASRLHVGSLRLGAADLADQDGEGLTDVAERAVGTFVDVVDSDGDGIDDFSELRLGLDPLGGGGLVTGKISEIEVGNGGIRDLVVAPSVTQAGRVYAYVLSSTTELNFETFAFEVVSEFLHVVDVSNPRIPVITSTLRWDLANEKLPRHGDPLGYDQSTGMLSLSILRRNAIGVFEPRVRLFQTGEDRLVPRVEELRTDARITVLKDGLAYVVSMDPNEPYSIPSSASLQSIGICIYCIPNDSVNVYDYANGELLQSYRFANRVIHDIEVNDRGLYAVGNSVRWFRTGETTVSFDVALHVDRVAVRSDGTLGSARTTRTIPNTSVYGVDHRLAALDGLVSVTMIATGPTPGIVNLLDTGTRLEIVGPHRPISAARVTYDGNGLAAYSIAPFVPFVNVLDFTDPTITDRLVASFNLSSPFGQSLFAYTAAPGIYDGRLYTQDGASLTVINYLPVDGDGTPPNIRLNPWVLDVDPQRPGIQVPAGSRIVLDAEVLTGRVQAFDLYQDSQFVAAGLAPDYTFSLIAPDVDDQPLILELFAAATEVTGRIVTTEVVTIEVVRDTFGPRVIEVNPPSGFNAPDNLRKVTVRFDEPLASGSWEAAGFQIWNNQTLSLVSEVGISLASSRDEVVLAFNPLPPGSYEIRFNQAAITDRLGNPMPAGQFASEFSIGGRAVEWIGGAGNWNDPTMWSGGQVPDADDVVTIPAGGGEILIENLSLALRKLITARPLTIRDSDIVLSESIEFSGEITVSNLSLSGGTLQGIGGDAIARIQPGRDLVLDNVVLAGELVIDQANASLVLRGTTVFDGTTTIRGNNARVSVVGQSEASVATLGSGTLIFDSASGFQGHRISLFAAQWEIGSDLTIEFRGTVEVSSQTLSDSNLGVVLNRGELRIAPVGTLRMFINGLLGDGSVLIGDAARLRLFGETPASSLHQVVNPNGLVEISGDLINHGEVFRRTAALGDLLFSGGRLLGGSYDQGDALSTSFSSPMSFDPGNTLEGVTLVGSHTFVGGTVRLAGAWVNAGSILLNANDLVLDGTFTHFGNLNAHTGRVVLAGTYDNRGKTLDLTGPNGPWHINGGRLIGGTVRVADGLRLTFSSNINNRFSGVGIDGTLRITNARLRVDGGISVSGDLLNSSGTSMTFDGDGETQTLIVGGVTDPRTIFVGTRHTLILASTLFFTTTSGFNFLRADGAVATRLINNASISPRMSTLVDVDQFENRGTITVNAPAAVLTLNRIWNNQGVIELSNGLMNLGGTFTVDDLGDFRRLGGELRVTGVLNNVGRTFATDAFTGSVVFSDGTLLGGVLAGSRDGTTMSDRGVQGITLDGVTIASDMHYVINTRMRLSNEYEVLGSIRKPELTYLTLLGNTRVSQIRNIIVEDPSPDLIGGFTIQGTLDLEGTELDTTLFSPIGGFVLAHNATLVNGTLGNLSERLFVNSAESDYLGVDRITIAADRGLNNDLRLLGPLVVNANLFIHPGTSPPGEIQVGAGTQTVSGTGTIVFTGNSRIRGLEPTSGFVLAAGTTMRGSLIVGQFASDLVKFENHGRIEFTSGNTTLRATSVVNTGTLQATPGARVNVYNLTSNSGEMRIESNARITLLPPNAGFAFASLGSLVIDVGGTAVANRGELILLSNLLIQTSIMGDLTVRFVDGYDPAPGTRIELGRYDTIDSEFTSVAAEGLSTGKGLRAFVEDRILWLEILP